MGVPVVQPLETDEPGPGPQAFSPGRVRLADRQPKSAPEGTDVVLDHDAHAGERVQGAVHLVDVGHQHHHVPRGELTLEGLPPAHQKHEGLADLHEKILAEEGPGPQAVPLDGRLVTRPCLAPEGRQLAVGRPAGPDRL